MRISDWSSDVCSSDLPNPHGCDLTLSALTGEGMLQLQTLLMDRARALLPREGEYALNKRQRVAPASLETELESAIRTDDYLILAEHLRAVRGPLDALKGRAGTGDMLDRLFSDLVIGKKNNLRYMF